MNSVLGSILVTLGLYLLLWGKSNEAEDCLMKQAQIGKEDENNIDAESQATVTINSKSP